MNTTLSEKYFKEYNSNSSKVLKKARELVQVKYVNTLTPNFSYKNHIGEVILPNTCILL
jgi:chemotaxis methyl-accepting protein methylase